MNIYSIWNVGSSYRTGYSVTNSGKSDQPAFNLDLPDNEMIDRKRTLTCLHVVTGETVRISVDKSDPESMIAEIQAKDGSISEKVIDTSEVDPGNASFVEMLALSSSFKESGKMSSVPGIFASEVCAAILGTDYDINKKYDFSSMMKQEMDNLMKYGYMDTYAKNKPEYDLIIGKNPSGRRFEGDMVIPQPPKYDGYTFDNTISNKSKEAMTLDEYKQWFMNEIAQMPVSSWVKSSFSSGALVIKEEAFERMKNDSEYEQYVLNRVRSYYSASGLPIGSNNVSYEVIGASPEECYGYAGPAGNSASINSGNDESWWERRHKKLEEILNEIEEKKEYRERKYRAGQYLKDVLAHQDEVARLFEE